jgi:hypothetical protein
VLSSKIYRWGDVFSLSLPPGWVCEDSEGVVTIVRPDGAGALNISLIRVNGELADASLIARRLADGFVSQRAWDVGEADIRVKGTNAFAVSEFEFTQHGDDPSYWQVWHAVGAQRAALITYTSDPEDAEMETAERNEIVDSFRWINC